MPKQVTDMTGYADASDFDLSGVPELQAWPQGTYPAVVKTAQWKEFSTGNKGFAFSATVSGPEGEEKTIFWNDVLSSPGDPRKYDDARRKLRNSLVCMGIDAGALDRREIGPQDVAQQAVGAKIALKLRPGTDQNGQPREEVAFNGVLPPSRAEQAEASEFKFE